MTPCRGSFGGGVVVADGVADVGVVEQDGVAIVGSVTAGTTPL